MSAPEEPGRDRFPKPIAVGGGWAFLYVALALACAVAVGYSTLAMGRSWTDPAVLAPGVGAVWFAARALLGRKRR